MCNSGWYQSVGSWFGSEIRSTITTCSWLCNPWGESNGMGFYRVLQCRRPLPTLVWGSADLKAVEAPQWPKPCNKPSGLSARDVRISTYPPGLRVGHEMESGQEIVYCAEAQCKWLGRITILHLRGLMDSWDCVYVKTCISRPYVPKNVTDTHIMYVGTHTLHRGQGEGEFTDKQVFIHWEDLVRTDSSFPRST